MRYLLFVLTVLAAGCSLDVDYTGTYFACGANGACPENYVCVNNVCLPSTPPGPACSESLAAGGDHACSVRSDRTVWCWGRNDYGQLGDGTTTDRAEPVQVMGVTGAVSVAAGTMFSCAVLTDGSVQCWGLNAYGQLGDGSTSDSRTAVAVRNLTGATAVALGSDHACALIDGGGVSCWGGNMSGQLGDGLTGNRPLPSPVQGVNARTLVAGGAATCVIDNNRALQCWGDNTDGRFGLGDTMSRNRPAMVADNVTAVGLGDAHMCFATASGVSCAGHGDNGQLGNGVVASSPTPIAVPLPATVRALSLGNHFSCAIDDTNRSWCWGVNSNNQLAIGQVSSGYPSVTSLAPAAELAAGGSFTCVREETGAIQCVGSNRRGQLGDGRMTTTGAPQPVPSLTGVNKLAAGGGYTCAITSSKGVVCWGEGNNGELGNGTFVHMPTPTPVSGLADVEEIAGGSDHVCVRHTGGAVSCWGYAESGQLGDGKRVTRPTPAAVSLPGPATQVVSGDAHSCALVGGNVYCWGSNYHGQLGDGMSMTSSAVPVQVMTLTGITSIAASASTTCAITATGDVQCWGDNYYGQLSNGMRPTDSSVPVTAMGIANAVEVYGRGPRLFARLGDGSVRAWGYQCDGELGLGGPCTYYDATSVVAELASATKIAAGYSASCALMPGGAVWCWGPGYVGQVGDATYQGRERPVQVPGLTGIRDIAAGGEHVCAIAADNSVVCWGLGDRGQLGNGIVGDDNPVATQLVCE